MKRRDRHMGEDPERDPGDERGSAKRRGDIVPPALGPLRPPGAPLPGLFDGVADDPKEADRPVASGSRVPPWHRHPLAPRAEAARKAAEAATTAAPGSRARPLRVSELNRSIQTEIESAFPAVWIVGEISNLGPRAPSPPARPEGARGPGSARSAPGSGHVYFTLKDAGSEIAAVLFASAGRRLRFTPTDGAEVIACGRPTLWVPRGRYQFVVEDMEPRGRGSLLAAFEALKERLLSEGLFDPARKRPLPLLPRRIGVVTSPDGAALRDILKVLRRRHAGVSVLIAPVRVQGEGAGVEVADAIRALGRSGWVDVLIVGRGGGSIEDLWAFNEECVARAIASCAVPVVSAVGHETDVTIADFAADVRSATPSQAAEMVVASRQELTERLIACRARLASSARVVLGRARRRLDHILRRPGLAELPSRLASERQLLDDLAWRLAAAPRDRMALARRQRRELVLRLAPRHLLEVVGRRRDAVHALERRAQRAVRAAVHAGRSRQATLAGLLASLSPLGVLQRGYAICLDPSTGTVVRSFDQVGTGDVVAVKLAQGDLDCRVEASRRPKEDAP